MSKYIGKPIGKTTIKEVIEQADGTKLVVTEDNKSFFLSEKDLLKQIDYVESIKNLKENNRVTLRGAVVPKENKEPEPVSSDAPEPTEES